MDFSYFNEKIKRMLFILNKIFVKIISPLYYKYLFFQKGRFRMLMKRAFPAVTLTQGDFKLAYDFVFSMMKWNQCERPTVSQMLRHPFLSASTDQNKQSVEKSPQKDEKQNNFEQNNASSNSNANKEKFEK